MYPSSMFASLNNQRILVTGSSTGIGRAIALECARAGADVIVNCRRSVERANAVAEEIRSLGRHASVIQADVSVADDRHRLLEECGAIGPVTGLVNNAGADLLTTELRSAPFADRLSALLQTDVMGTIELSRSFGQYFKAAGSGCILTVGWDQSDRGMEGDSGELFATAKNAIMGFTRSLAVSVSPIVRVNCIAPGWIRTAWGETAGEYWQQRVLAETPLKRWGEPQDIANMARFLLSNEASYITGQVFNVNGGAVR
ncbi:MAG: SDR family oxidoreductase [Planctomycetaceae bacterium]|nr:SDR family oxidoreductase [Planctomycetaceae bacterium]